MKMKKIAALFLALLTLLSLAACGASSPAKAADSAYRTESAYAVQNASYDYAEAEMPMPAPAEDYAAAGGFAASAKEEAGPANAPSAGDIAVDKIIYSASVTVETTEFDEALKGLEALVAQYGGFIESSSISGNNYYRSSRGYASTRCADYRIRIPSRDFSTVMNELSTLGNVPYSSTYTENITSQYYDSAARLEAYRTEEKSLLDMMEQAETVKDLLEIQSYLSDVRYRIESLQSTLTNWDRQVSYSTISLSLQEVEVYTPEATASYGQQLGLAIRRGLNSVGEFLRDLLLWLLEALPSLILLAAFVVLVVFLIRRLRRRAKERREKKYAPKPQAENETKS